MRAANSLRPDVPGAAMHRIAAEGYRPTVLSEIYRDETNIAIWRRSLCAKVRNAIGEFVARNGSFRAAIATTPSRAHGAVSTLLGGAEGAGALGDDVAELVDMFCCLFDLGEVGLRMSVLDQAMCPKFHFDRVPCRLVTTYHGVGTQWLPHHLVERLQPAPGTPAMSPLQPGVDQNKTHICQLGCGDVGLLKGALWEGNEHAGLVHRSPSLAPGEKRLVLTLDFLG